ncbi:MAG: uroporphyrinogen-III synthase [Caulobacteraceae bacterium]
MSPRLIWITRAASGAAATAERVRGLGHEPIVQPLIELRPVANPDLNLDGIAAIAFTSANGVRAFAEVSGERALKVFAVGAATAQAARSAGFKTVLSTDGDVAALARGLAARKRELKGAVLHPGAAEPAGDLVGAMASEDIEVRPLTLYESVDVVLSPDFLERIPAIDAALVYSPKGAKALAKCLRKTPAPQLRALCLSKAVAKPLARAKLAQLASSPLAVEAGLLNLIDR